MRTFFCIVLAALFIFMPVFVYSQNSISLDQAVQNGANYLSTRVPKAARAAVLAFKCDNPLIGEFVLRKLTSVLVNGNWFTVVARDAAALESLSREMNYQMSGEVSDETSLSIGKQLGAQLIITGSFARSGQNWRLELLAVDVESAQITGQWSTDNVQPDSAWASLASSQSASLSFSGDNFSERDKVTVAEGLRAAMQTWKTALELDENSISPLSFSINVFYNQMPAVPSFDMALLHAEVDVVFSHNGRRLCKTGPYMITETTDALIARRIAEQLRGDHVFFTQVQESIK